MHIVRNTAGTMGVSVNDALTAFTEMQNDFAPYGICFTLASQDFIDNDDFVLDWGDNCQGGASISLNDDNDFEELYAAGFHEDGIDIFLLPDNANYNRGFAFGIPGSAFLISGINSLDNLPFRVTRTFTHEMGHSLGLHHTFRAASPLSASR